MNNFGLRTQLRKQDKSHGKVHRKIVAITIASLLIASFGTYTAYRAFAATQYAFPQAQTFSIGVSYSFASSTSNNLLLPGSTGNVTLSIVSGLRIPTSAVLTFNSTSPNIFGWYGNQGSPNFGFCPSTPNAIQMTLNGVTFLPSNENPSTVENPVGCGVPPQSVTVTINPGTNTYMAAMTVSSNAAITTVFSISWYASA